MTDAEEPPTTCLLCSGADRVIDLGDGLAICEVCRGMQQRRLDEEEDNFDRPYIPPDAVTPAILLGSVNSTVDAAEMHALGVTRVLVAASGLKASFPDEFEYLCIPWSDQLTQRIDADGDLDRALAFLQAAEADHVAHVREQEKRRRQQQEQQEQQQQQQEQEEEEAAVTVVRPPPASAAPAPKVLVHCHAGVSRSATIVIAHLMRSWKCSYEVAEVYVRAKRPVIFPNSAFARQLRAMEPELTGGGGPVAVVAMDVDNGSNGSSSSSSSNCPVAGSSLSVAPTAVAEGEGASAVDGGDGSGDGNRAGE